MVYIAIAATGTAKIFHKTSIYKIINILDSFENTRNFVTINTY